MSSNLMTESECRYYFDLFYGRVEVPKSASATTTGRRLQQLRIIVTDEPSGASFGSYFDPALEPYGTCAHYKASYGLFNVGDVVWSNEPDFWNACSAVPQVAVCYCKMAPATPPVPPSLAALAAHALLAATELAGTAVGAVAAQPAAAAASAALSAAAVFAQHHAPLRHRNGRLHQSRSRSARHLRLHR